MLKIWIKKELLLNFTFSQFQVIAKPTCWARHTKRTGRYTPNHHNSYGSVEPLTQSKTIRSRVRDFLGKVEWVRQTPCPLAWHAELSALTWYKFVKSIFSVTNTFSYILFFFYSFCLASRLTKYGRDGEKWDETGFSLEAQ